MSAQHELYLSLLRPSIVHILRAAGFHAARPAALDIMVDLAARYLELVASRAADFAYLNHNGPLPTTVDVRMALQHAGALRPEMSAMEEQMAGDDDTRGVDALIAWFEGAQAREIRRVAGMEPAPNEAAAAVAAAAAAAAAAVDGSGPGSEADQAIIAALRKDDWLAALKKKHSKTGDEARWQGTMMGRDLPARDVLIEGPGLPSIRQWEAARLTDCRADGDGDDRGVSVAESG